MATNTLINPDMITMETLRIIHQEANFLGNLYKAYDDSYAQSGAKIGDTLRIRLPNQFTAQEDNPVLPTNIGGVAEPNTSLTINARVTIPFEFSSTELTLDIDRFSERYIKPAALKIVSTMENRIMKDVYANIYNQVYYDPAATGANAFDALIDAKALLGKTPTPMRMRYANVGNYFAADFVKDNKELYNPQQQIGRNYREGKIAGMVAGFERVYENSLWPIHTVGNDAGGPQTTGQITTSTVGYDGGNASTRLRTGDLIRFASVNAVHLESKEDLKYPKTFVVTAGDDAGATGSVEIWPIPIASGAYQNVTALPADNAAITLARETGTTDAPADGDNWEMALGYLKEAIACATADLTIPRGMDMASRQVHDGISLRFVRGFDIRNDQFISRLDVLYGWRVLRPEFCCRVARKI